MKVYARKRSSTRTLILNTAIALLAEVGYDRLTITQIADAAEVGRGTIYHYFGDKDGLVLHIFQRYYDQIEEEVNRRMLQYESPQRELVAWQITFEHLAQIKPLFQKMDSPGGQILWRRFADYAQQHFRASLEGGHFLYPQWMSLPIDVMAAFTGGAVLNVMQRWISGELEYEPADLAAMVHRLLYHVPDEGTFPPIRR